MSKAKIKSTKLPGFLRDYFWDVRFDELDIKKSRFFVLKRVLDRADTGALRWLLRNYNTKEIVEVLYTTRDISQVTANFWTDYLKLDKPHSPIQWGLSS